ncbi:MAG: hypothetical protein JXA97_02965 [Anaerolineales bacterium]|nr:hypothetical protein [Anaerolineales bacterium]
MLRKSMLVAGLALIAGACSPSAPAPTATVQATAPLEYPVETRIAEAIWIMQPASGSRVTAPLVLRGEASPTFEQTLIARLVNVEGAVILQQPVQIAAPLGERGIFEAAIPFAVEGIENALLQVYSISARDGGILHLASAGLMLQAEGPAEIRVSEEMDERLVIASPAAGSDLLSGSFTISGYGTSSFEGTLVLSLLDAEGNILAEEILIAASEEMGQAGPFQVEMTFSVTERQPGRLVITDPLPVFNGIGHVASIPVMLLPE